MPSLKLGNHHSAPILLGVYLSYILLFTLAPYNLSSESESGTELYSSRFEDLSALSHLTAWDVVSNFLLFLPFGFFFVALPAVSGLGVVARILSSALSVFILSLGIEICQMFLPRYPSIADVFLNTLGGIGGAILGVFYYGTLTRIVQECWWKMQNDRWLARILIGYLIIVGVVFSVPLFRTDFSNWDKSFTFQLGNEATLDRPWLGKLYLVAVYDRALRADEILTNFTAGPYYDDARERTKGGLVMLYPFLEGSGSTVHDHSSSGPPFDLLIRDPGHVNWLSPNGLEFLGETIITRPEPTEKLFHRVTTNAHTLTVEAWIAPAPLHQAGPARIISYSVDPYRRNFTLGQAKQDIVFRLRTPVTGENGIRPQLATVDGPLTAGMQHVVITYLKNLSTLYLNGEEHAKILLDGSLSWELPSIFDIVVGPGMNWFSWPVILFPLGLISYPLYARSGYHNGIAVFLSFLTGLGFLGGTEALQIILLRRETNFLLLYVGTVVVLMSVLTGVVLTRGDQAS